MISRTTEAFRRALDALPPEIRLRAREGYLLFRSNPSHPSLRFKRVHASRPIYSVRITLAYRALGLVQDDTIIWFWVGSHDEYERLIRARQ